MADMITQTAIKKGHTRVAYEHADPMKVYFDIHHYIAGLFR